MIASEVMECDTCVPSLINPRRLRSEDYSSCLVCVCVSAPFRPLQVKVSPENDNNASSRQDRE